MKNKWLLIVTAVALSSLFTNVFAQVGIGAKIGLNLSNVYNSDDQTMQADPKLGLAFGGFLAIPLGEYFGIQPEVLFSQKGFQGKGSIFGSNYSFSRTTNYIDIPILFAVKPSKMFTLLVGPQYSYLISQKYVFNSAIVNTQQEQQFNNDNVRKNTVCVTGGADINLEKIVLGARVGIDAFNNNGDGTSTTPKYKNVWYQVSFGYKF